MPFALISALELAAPDAIASVTAPSLAVSAAVGTENGTIPLVIDTGLVDATGTQTLTVTVSGLPEGATLSAGTLNAHGSYTLTADQLAGLTLTPAPDSGEDFSLTVTATATDTTTGVAATAATQLPVTVIDAVEVAAPDAIANVTAPTLSVSAAVGAENTAIPLVIDTGLVDATGTQTLTVTVSGLPVGASLSAGTLNEDGSYTLTGEQLAGLTLTPAPDSGDDFSLTVTATATDTTTGVEATAATQLPVTVIDAVEVAAPEAIPSVTAPTLSVAAAVGGENGTIPLVIDTGLVDATGTQTLTVTVSGLPEGATLSAGTLNPDGSYTLTGEQLAGLTLTPAEDSGEDFSLTVTATATDTTTGVEATAATQLPVTVIDAVEVAAPEAIANVSAPTLSVSAAVGAENTAIPLVIDTGLVDLAGTQTLTVTVSGLPEGATLSAGTLNPDGSYTLTGEQLAGLTLTPAEDSGEDFSLTVTATATDTTTGVEATAATQLPVTVIDAVEVAAPDAIADVTAPTLSVSAAVGAENGTIPLVIDTGLVDATGTQTLTVTVSGLPEGATLSAGTLNPDGSYTLTGEQLAGLTLTPAPDSGEDFSLTVTATATDTTTSVEATASTSLPVTVIDAVEVAAPEAIAEPALIVSDAAGFEDEAIALDIQVAPDGTGSTEILYAISGLPLGATLSAGTAAADGAWILTADELAGLTLTPPQDLSGSIELTVTPIIVGTDEVAIAGASASLTVDVQAVADEPTLVVTAAAGLQDTAIPLTIGAVLTDIDGSESLAITIDSIPDGATLSAGTLNADGSYTLTSDELAGLALTPARGSTDDFALTVTATATESSTGLTASTTASLPVEVIGAVDALSLTTSTIEEPTTDTTVAATTSTEMTEAEFALALEEFTASVDTTASTDEAVLDPPTTSDSEPTPTETAPEPEPALPPPDTTTTVTVENTLQNL